jgi:hypothetical protein
MLPQFITPSLKLVLKSDAKEKMVISAQAQDSAYPYE